MACLRTRLEALPRDARLRRGPMRGNESLPAIRQLHANPLFGGMSTDVGRLDQYSIDLLGGVHAHDLHQRGKRCTLQWLRVSWLCTIGGIRLCRVAFADKLNGMVVGYDSCLSIELPIGAQRDARSSSAFLGQDPTLDERTTDHVHVFRNGHRYRHMWWAYRQCCQPWWHLADWIGLVDSVLNSRPLQVVLAI